jgi:hypothetical protein
VSLCGESCLDCPRDGACVTWISRNGKLVVTMVHISYPESRITETPANAIVVVAVSIAPVLESVEGPWYICGDLP